MYHFIYNYVNATSTWATSRLLSPAGIEIGASIGSFGALSFTSIKLTDNDNGALAAFPKVSLATTCN